MTESTATRTRRPACSGTASISRAEAVAQGVWPAEWETYGRRFCTTCGNIAFTKKSGDLVRHVAKLADNVARIPAAAR